MEHSLLNETLQHCALDLAKEFPDFNILNQELLEAWMEQKIKSPFYKGLIVDLIGSPYFKTELESLKQSSESNEIKEAKYISLIDVIQNCYLGKARFILSGGYALILEWISAQDIKEVHDLKSCIKQALGLEQNPEDFADLDIQTCLRFLSDFIDERPAMVLDTTFFGSQDKMKPQLMRSRSAVAERIEQEYLVRPGVPA